jgi:hypothetical protein
MKILLLTPFLLGNSAPAGAAIEGLIALFVVTGVFVGLVWGAIKLWEIGSRDRE